MSSNPPGFIERQASFLGDMLANLNFLFVPETDDDETSESEIVDSETTAHISSDEESDAKSCENLSNTSKGVKNDSTRIEATIEFEQIKSGLNARSDTVSSNKGQRFSREKVEKMVKCFKLVIKVCGIKISSKKLSVQSRDVVDKTFVLVTDTTDDKELQDVLIKRYQADPDLMKQVTALGEDIYALRNPAKKDKKPRLLVRIFSRNSDASRTLPWYKRFLDALWTLCKQLVKLSAKAISLIVESIMACLDVAKAIAQKIFRAIKAALLWLRRSICDPQGEINRILEDSQKSNPEKAIGVIGVVATALVGTLILAFGISEVGPYGVGAAAVSAAAAASVAIRTAAPRDRERT